jgi:hypothetical protein
MPGEARGLCWASSTGVLRLRPPTRSIRPLLPRQDTARHCCRTGVAIVLSVHLAWDDRINCPRHCCWQCCRCQRGAMVALTNVITTTMMTLTTQVATQMCAPLMMIFLQTPQAVKILFVLLLPPFACPQLRRHWEPQQFCRVCH